MLAAHLIADDDSEESHTDEGNEGGRHERRHGAETQPKSATWLRGSDGHGVRRIMISARFAEPLLGQPLSHPGYRALTPRYGCSGLRPAGRSLFPLREPWLAQGAHARLAKVALHHPGDVGVG